MADQSSIFNEENKEATPPVVSNIPNGNGEIAPNNPDFADLLSQIKNERGEPKYKSIPDALNGLLHAQQHISTLASEKQQQEQELRQAREEVERINELEETLKRLASNQNPPSQNQQEGFDESKIAELITRTLTSREKEVVSKQNVASVVSHLQQVFGADAEKKFYTKAQELGLTQEEMNALASKSPSAVLAMLGVNGQVTKPVTLTQGTINSSGVQLNPQSLISRNDKTALIGATTEDVRFASDRANKMVDELHSQGKSIHDLIDPKVFFKHFGK